MLSQAIVIHVNFVGRICTGANIIPDSRMFSFGCLEVTFSV